MPENPNYHDPVSDLIGFQMLCKQQSEELARTRESSSGTAAKIRELEQQLQSQQGEIERLTNCLTDANAALMDWENREGAVCPEDVGFEELIKTLRAKCDRMTGLLKEWPMLMRAIGNGLHMPTTVRDLIQRTDSEVGQ